MMKDQSMLDQPLLEMLVARELETHPPAPPDEKKLSPMSKGMLMGGNMADLASTIYALHQGAQEGNPVYGNRPSTGKVLAIKGGGTLAQLLLMQKLAKSKPKLANALSKGLGAAAGGMAAWNLTQARK